MSDISRPSAEQLSQELSRMEKEELRRKIRSLIIFGAVGIFLVLFLCFVGFHETTDNGICVTIPTVFAHKGDLTAYPYGNKTVTGRIIALEGDTVDIDSDGTVYVNGNAISEEYAKNKESFVCYTELPCTVSEGSCFILCDDRSREIDSRSLKVGCIKEKQLLGKIIFQLK